MKKHPDVNIAVTEVDQEPGLLHSLIRRPTLPTLREISAPRKKRQRNRLGFNPSGRLCTDGISVLPIRES
jgi:hypothetical protein